jgi:hypothetical protein
MAGYAVMVEGVRHLLVRDMDPLAVDEGLNLEPISYLVAWQRQEPCEVVGGVAAGQHARSIAASPGASSRRRRHEVA